ncbi:hypothetical protein VV02_23930 [Luteipulveratus mongoliensis]|uniref:Helix-turn-helix domain-containing protein n=1 Tax=Luteipulveratus mongoliensis TaxID=571913 RepID=A0A0K1JRC4_9MICO|nr:hypothetical protein VV02_23930 [Luteipulveratus mongoliensis]
MGSAALQLLTVAEVCSLLSVSRWQVYRLINGRELGSVKIGRRRLVPRVDLDAFVDALRRRSEVA